jgi:hypothetical protein
MNTHTHPPGKGAPEKEMLFVGDQFPLFVDTTGLSGLFSLFCYCIIYDISNPAKITKNVDMIKTK